jgi:hypothetical protein
MVSAFSTRNATRNSSTSCAFADWTTCFTACPARDCFLGSFVSSSIVEESRETSEVAEDMLQSAHDASRRRCWLGRSSGLRDGRRIDGGWSLGYQRHLVCRSPTNAGPKRQYSVPPSHRDFDSPSQSLMAGRTSFLFILLPDYKASLTSLIHAPAKYHFLD